jgi:hypothetical protein
VTAQLHVDSNHLKVESYFGKIHPLFPGASTSVLSSLFRHRQLSTHFQWL